MERNPWKEPIFWGQWGGNVWTEGELFQARAFVRPEQCSKTGMGRLKGDIVSVSSNRVYDFVVPGGTLIGSYKCPEKRLVGAEP